MDIGAAQVSVFSNHVRHEYQATGVLSKTTTQLMRHWQVVETLAEDMGNDVKIEIDNPSRKNVCRNLWLYITENALTG
jgi:hypothetical protein